MPKRILLADDSVTIARMVEITFAHEDYVVTAVTSADDALARASHERPDVVLADAVMPGKSGYDLCAALREAGLRDAPVLILASNANPYDEARGQRVGADGGIPKPFDTQSLIDRVGQLLAQKASAARPAAATPTPTSPARSGPVRIEPLAPPIHEPATPVPVAAQASKPVVDVQKLSVERSAPIPTTPRTTPTSAAQRPAPVLQRPAPASVEPQRAAPEVQRPAPVELQRPAAEPQRPPSVEAQRSTEEPQRPTPEVTLPPQWSSVAAMGAAGAKSLPRNNTIIGMPIAAPVSPGAGGAPGNKSVVIPPKVQPPTPLSARPTPSLLDRTPTPPAVEVESPPSSSVPLDFDMPSAPSSKTPPLADLAPPVRRKPAVAPPPDEMPSFDEQTRVAGPPIDVLAAAMMGAPPDVTAVYDLHQMANASVQQADTMAADVEITSPGDGDIPIAVSDYMDAPPPEAAPQTPTPQMHAVQMPAPVPVPATPSAPIQAVHATPAARPAPATDLTPTLGHRGVASDLPQMPRPSLIPNAPTPRGRAATLMTPAVAEAIQRIAARGPEYEAIAHLSREVIEQIAWEVVPELAELILRGTVESHLRERA